MNNLNFNSFGPRVYFSIPNWEFVINKWHWTVKYYITNIMKYIGVINNLFNINVQIQNFIRANNNGIIYMYNSFGFQVTATSKKIKWQIKRQKMLIFSPLSTKIQIQPKTIYCLLSKPTAATSGKKNGILVLRNYEKLNKTLSPENT